MRAVRWSPLVVIALVVAGCGQTHVSTLRLTAKDRNGNFDVKPGQEIVVTLASNPSTGYRWKLFTTNGPSGIVTLVAHRYVAPTQSRSGAPGEEIWRFKAVRSFPGAVGPVLYYMRPGEAAWRVPEAHHFAPVFRVR
jgi:predicted secreted protein